MLQHCRLMPSPAASVATRGGHPGLRGRLASPPQRRGDRPATPAAGASSRRRRRNNCVTSTGCRLRNCTCSRLAREMICSRGTPSLRLSAGRSAAPRPETDRRLARSIIRCTGGLRWMEIAHGSRANSRPTPPQGGGPETPRRLRGGTWMLCAHGRLVALSVMPIPCIVRPRAPHPGTVSRHYQQ